MATLTTLSGTLRTRLAAVKLTQDTVRKETGISRRTLTNVLSGTADYKITTLLAVADRLGLDVVLLPKEAARAINAPAATQPPVVVSTVQAALDRIKAE